MGVFFQTTINVSPAGLPRSGRMLVQRVDCGTQCSQQPLHWNECGYLSLQTETIQGLKSLSHRSRWVHWNLMRCVCVWRRGCLQSNSCFLPMGEGLGTATERRQCIFALTKMFVHSSVEIIRLRLSGCNGGSKETLHTHSMRLQGMLWSSLSDTVCDFCHLSSRCQLPEERCKPWWPVRWKPRRKKHTALKQ